MGLLAEYIPQGGAVLRFTLNYALRLSCDKLRQRFKYCALRLPCAKLKRSPFNFAQVVVSDVGMELQLYNLSENVV